MAKGTFRAASKDDPIFWIGPQIYAPVSKPTTVASMRDTGGVTPPSADPELQRLTEEAYNNAHAAIQRVVSQSEQTDEPPSPTGQPPKD